VSPKGSIISALFRIIGWRVFVSFGLVALLIVALLSAVTVTSRYAMQRYVASQVERMPWDISVYQTAEVPLSGQVREAITSVAGVAKSERLYFLRTIPPYAVTSEVDGQQLRSPWISLLTATDPELIPPDLRPSGQGVVLVLVGSKAQMGDALLRLQDRKRFQMVAQPRDEHHHHDVDEEHKHPLGIIAVSTPIERVIRVDATEINRWFLEKTSAPTLVPELGLILVSAWNEPLVLNFDGLSRGFIHEHGHDIHGSPGEYFPEIIHVARLDRVSLISGWDIDGSLDRIVRAGSHMTDDVQEVTARAAVDHNLGVMFVRMSEIAKRIALISLLVSLPLLVMAAILLSNLSALLLLNERRNLGLLRLRGASGKLIGRTLLLAVGLGGLLGGIAGAVLGTMLPLVIYYGGIPPIRLTNQIQEPLFLGLFLLIGVSIALLSGYRLINEAMQVSPLDASKRTNFAEAGKGRVRAGVIEWLALLLGGAKLVAWVADWSLAGGQSAPWFADLDRALDFIALPLFIYGLVSVVASSEKLMAAIMKPAAWLLAGPLREVSLRHMGTRRHRAASFLLIVALMTSLALYPTVMIAVFDNKTERAARVQLGGHMQITLNGLELIPPESQAKGDLGQRLSALQQQLDPLLAKLERQPEVKHVSYMVEGLVEGLYIPDRGFSGLPMYLIADFQRHLQTVYHEAALGQGESFSVLIRRLGEGKVLSSSSVGAFYKKRVDEPMPVGRSTVGTLERVPFGGAVRFLPGVPLRTVDEREGFISARVDYLNHLFTNSPYLIGDARNQALARLDVLIPRVVLTVTASGKGTAGEFQDSVLKAIGMKPLDVHDLDTEIGRLGGDMYIYLARQNVQIYLLGGLMLALIGIFAVAYANYVEDRRTLALLRIRGAGPLQVVRFFIPNIIGPSMAGFVIGVLVALAGGYGITKLVWELRQLQTVLNYLPTQLAISSQSAIIAGLLLAMVIAIGILFGRWVFARTARQSLLEG
jgi:hypothetical protein